MRADRNRRLLLLGVSGLLLGGAVRAGGLVVAPAAPAAAGRAKAWAKRLARLPTAALAVRSRAPSRS